eukprot:IDg22016t1
MEMQTYSTVLRSHLKQTKTFEASAKNAGLHGPVGGQHASHYCTGAVCNIGTRFRACPSTPCSVLVQYRGGKHNCATLLRCDGADANRGALYSTAR